MRFLWYWVWNTFFFVTYLKYLRRAVICNICHMYCTHLSMQLTSWPEPSEKYFCSFKAICLMQEKEVPYRILNVCNFVIYLFLLYFLEASLVKSSNHNWNPQSNIFLFGLFYCLILWHKLVLGLIFWPLTAHRWQFG